MVFYLKNSWLIKYFFLKSLVLVSFLLPNYLHFHKIEILFLKSLVIVVFFPKLPELLQIIQLYLVAIKDKSFPLPNCLHFHKVKTFFPISLVLVSFLQIWMCQSIFIHFLILRWLLSLLLQQILNCFLSPSPNQFLQKKRFLGKTSINWYYW